MSTTNGLRPLPCRTGPLIGVRESIAYLRDPDGFIAERHQQFGPVFGTTLFFRPTAVLGGPEAVEQFIRLESSISESALPPAFTALHTADGALNQAGEKHRSTRRGYAALFSPSNLESYLPGINRSMAQFTADIAQRESTFIALEAKHLCLNLYAELFAGESLTTKEIEAFILYNDALLSLSKQLPSFRRGEKALAELQQSMRRRLERHRRGELDGACFRIFTENLDEHGRPWSDERIATATMLMVWGAYIEVASLMASCLIQTRQRPDVRDRILKEAAIHNLENPVSSSHLAAWDLPFVQGVLRESLRLMPPAGGGFRLTSEDIEVSGYSIPAGTVVTADPRIGNSMSALFPEPQSFTPERWMRDLDGNNNLNQTRGCPFAGSALRLPKEGWFPGGIGKHGCPGLPLAELSVRVFLVRWMQTIQNWEAASEQTAAIPYTLVPIRIPTDAYRLNVVSSR
jgi:cytochrome P450